MDPKTVMKRLGHHTLATVPFADTDAVIDTMSTLLVGLGQQSSTGSVV
jgi:hypothetical protein